MEQITQRLNYTAVCLCTSTNQQFLPHPYPSAQFLFHESPASLEDDGNYEVFFTGHVPAVFQML